MNLQSTFEGVQIAVDSLRSDKVRAFLTILGIGIGVATVTGMGAIMNGVQGGINADMEAIGPANFVVTRWDRTSLTVTAGKPPWDGTPRMQLSEAHALEDLPSVASVTPAAFATVPVRAGSRELSGIGVQ